MKKKLLFSVFVFCVFSNLGAMDGNNFSSIEEFQDIIKNYCPTTQNSELCVNALLSYINGIEQSIIFYEKETGRTILTDDDVREARKSLRKKYNDITDKHDDEYYHNKVEETNTEPLSTRNNP